jgi:hypothetical protein
MCVRFLWVYGEAGGAKRVARAFIACKQIVMLPKDIRIVREHVKAWNIDVLIYPEVSPSLAFCSHLFLFRSPCQLLQLGMDKTTYFLSFSRLAPVQATWWGNADTSGVPAVDYFLTSEYEHTGVEERYTEEVFPLKYVRIAAVSLCGGWTASDDDLTCICCAGAWESITT